MARTRGERGSRAEVGASSSRAVEDRRRRPWAAVVGAGLSALLFTACSTTPESSNGGADGADGADADSATSETTAGGTETGTGGGPRDPDAGSEAPRPVADPTAVLADFEVPDESSGFSTPDPLQCPAVDSAPILAAFPDARTFQATSREVEDADASDDEVTVECRLTYEVDLSENECTFLELREVTFTPTGESVIDDHIGALTTTTGRTYFTGRAQKEGAILAYTVEAGCDGDSDLSVYEDEFRSAWAWVRDAFIEAAPFEQP